MYPEGLKIVKVRKMTKKEYNDNAWSDHHQVVVIELEDGSKLFPSCDEEGNGGGVFFGEDKEGEAFGLHLE